ncbi:MAG TPA: hypothetical protein VGZ90_13450 [Puia sp.]|jgi:hypothetical protein|nr:hypothetical protein [Puia sp.]
MLDINNLVQWQLKSPNGHVYPWWTHDFLTCIEKWDLSDKVALEWGGGWSSIWLASRARRVFTIETNEKWIKDIQEYADSYNMKNLELIYRPCNEGDQSKIEYYTELPQDCSPDIVCVDGVLRLECIKKAMSLGRPIFLIVDNWQQSYVFMCPEAEEILKPFKSLVFEQKDHTDNDGINKWKTALFYLE